MAQFLNYKIINKKASPTTPPPTPHPPPPPPTSLSSTATPNTPNHHQQQLSKNSRDVDSNLDPLNYRRRRGHRGSTNGLSNNVTVVEEGEKEDALSFHDDSSYDYYFLKKNNNNNNNKTSLPESAPHNSVSIKQSNLAEEKNETTPTTAKETIKMNFVKRDAIKYNNFNEIKGKFDFKGSLYLFKF